uniref:WD repeat and HMG-box DNA-binding protein 1 n=1 Tax=Sphenodon punctatus TaxID=8508 RepID=A0A8D0GHZ7_SPHPU
MSKVSKKTPTSNSRTGNKQKSLVIKPLIPKPKSKQALAASFFQPRTPSANDKTAEEREEKAEKKVSETPAAATENAENKRPKTGFQMWLEENRSGILADNPDLEEADVIREGMSRFRTLSSDERMAWTEKAKGKTVGGDSADAKKRKRLEGASGDVPDSQEEKSKGDSSSAKKRKPLDQAINTKLSAFAFKQS